MASTASMTAGLVGMEQRGLGDRRVMMDLCRAVVLPGIMAASTTCLTRSLVTPEDGLKKKIGVHLTMGPVGFHPCQ